ncbi:MAG: class I SAM-dependent methyltransferase [Spirochaetes bacterium]|nr:class I SAM-dependent methyltransferase [Spirochaetota bacterium]
MTFSEIARISDDTERVSAVYDIFNEEKRLASKSAQVEFLTTIRIISRYLKPGSKILDLGAGTGAYSLYLAKAGHSLSAVDLVEKHVLSIRQKIAEQPDLDILALQGTALDLSAFAAGSFDLVLCLGPLYHLDSRQSQQRCLEEIRRVCKPDGHIACAFINNDMVIATESLRYNSSFLLEDSYDHSTFKVEDFPFVFHTVEACRVVLREGGLRILTEAASDGLSELMAEKINSLDDASWERWLQYHFYTCEKPEFFGSSNHLLFVCANDK